MRAQPGILLTMFPAEAIGVGILAVAGAALGPVLMSIARRQLRGSDRLGRSALEVAIVATATLFAVLGLKLWATPALLPGYLVLAAAAVVLAIVDLTEQRLPNRVVLPTTIGVATLLVIAGVLQGRLGTALGVVLGAIGLFSIYLLLAVIARGGIGMGDVKLALALGAATGALGLRAWLFGLIAGFLINGIASLIGIALHRITLRGRIPFGPSMLAGALLAVIVS